MRTFEYKGYNDSGRVLRGLVQAYDLKDAREKLTRQGVFPQSVTAAGSKRRGWGGSSPSHVFDLDARAAFYEESAAILKAGIPLSTTLALLVDSPEMGENRPVIAGIRDAIQEGHPLAQALAEASPRVGAFEEAVVSSGEKAGRLDEVLLRLAGYLEEQRRIRDRLMSALLYPVIILSLSVVVGFVMLFILLPSFQELLLESGIALPRITRWMMAGARIGAWLAPIIVLAGIVGGAYVRRAWKSKPSFRIAVDRNGHRIPLVRTFWGVLVNLRFSRTLSMLLTSGIPLIESLTQTGRALGSPWVAEQLAQATEAVQQGTPLSDALQAVTPLNKTLPGWIRAGEAAGDVPGMLETAAGRAQEQWEHRISRTMTLVESSLIVIVGLFVLLLALSVLLPILSLNQSLQ